MPTRENTNWISEKQASEIIELPATFFRKLVLKGSLKGVIKYLSLKRKPVLYCLNDLKNYMFEDSFYTGLFLKPSY